MTSSKRVKVTWLLGNEDTGEFALLGIYFVYCELNISCSRWIFVHIQKLIQVVATELERSISNE